MDNIEALSLDITKNGLIQPIFITPDNILIAGERRMLAAKKLGWAEIEALTMTVRDYEHQLHCEISENENRKDFTPSERHELGQRLEQVEKLKAKERQAIAGSENLGIDRDYSLQLCFLFVLILFK